jgi:hypothetical protein
LQTVEQFRDKIKVEFNLTAQRVDELDAAPPTSVFVSTSFASFLMAIDP